MSIAQSCGTLLEIANVTLRRTPGFSRNWDRHRIAFWVILSLRSFLLGVIDTGTTVVSDFLSETGPFPLTGTPSEPVLGGMQI